MVFDSLSDFFQMGTHGSYVWSTYAISFLALAGLFLSTRMQRKQLTKSLKKRYRREQNR